MQVSHMGKSAVAMGFTLNKWNVSAGELNETTYIGSYNYARPLIRYEIEMLNDEVCGRGLPLMKFVEGRSDLFMQNPDGSIFSPIIWTLIMGQIPGVGQFKAIQERKGLIRILVVRDQAFSEITTQQIVHDVRRSWARGMHLVDVEVVEEIPKEPLGKVRCAVSKVGRAI